MSRSGTARGLAAALLGLGVTAAVSFAQPPRPPLDPLGEARARQAVNDQKAEVEVTNAIADATRVARTNPAKAVQLLRRAEVVVDSPVVSAAARKKLLELLEQKIAAIQGRPLPEAGPKPDPLAAGAKKDREAAYESYKAEVKDVNDGIQRISKYKQNGLDRAAADEIAKLAKTYPNNLAVMRLQDQDGFADRVRDSMALADLQRDRVAKALTSAQASATPIGGNGDVEFPKDWKEKTRLRNPEAKLTEAERKILESLNKPVTVNFSNLPLDEALQDLSNSLNQKLFLDKKSVEDLGIDLRKPVSLQANMVSARTVLRQVLASQGLTFVIKDQVIQVVDVERAKNMLVTRVYYLGDLVQGNGPFGGIQWGPLLNMQQTTANVDTIIKTITSSIDPLSWKERGGPCSITFHFPSMSIIVRASAEVHASLGATLGGGK